MYLFLKVMELTYLKRIVATQLAKTVRSKLYPIPHKICLPLKFAEIAHRAHVQFYNKGFEFLIVDPRLLKSF